MTPKEQLIEDLRQNLTDLRGLQEAMNTKLNNYKELIKKLTEL
jgi:hypothetical protein